MSPHRTIDF